MTEVTGTLAWCLQLLAKKGLRYSTVIDLGCSDGHFFLDSYCDGTFAGAIGVNVDPNPLYEPSLRAIKDATGGHYVIAAASDSDGETEITSGAHPYWTSLRPAGDIYWEQVNRLSAEKIRVQTVTVDSLRKKLNLAGPFLIKLDVQGAEVAALRGARETLAETDVVVCEADLRDFRAIDGVLNEAGFDLFDFTELRRIGDQSLGWLYPVYLNRRREGIRQRSFWDPRINEMIVNSQQERRKWILAHNAQLLEKLKTQGRR